MNVTDTVNRLEDKVNKLEIRRIGQSGSLCEITVSSGSKLRWINWSQGQENVALKEIKDYVFESTVKILPQQYQSFSFNEIFSLMKDLMGYTNNTRYLFEVPDMYFIASSEDFKFNGKKLFFKPDSEGKPTYRIEE